LESAASIFLRFLKFGCLAWGGPAAQIAMIKRECVDEEGWLDERGFQRQLAVYQVLPGPEASSASTSVACAAASSAASRLGSASCCRASC
jgi:chromate transport protein ChrA